MAIEHALETTPVPDTTGLEVSKYEIPVETNPYFLPWAMRGILEEERVKTDMQKEIAELLKSFEDWKPSSKVLKDVKFRLEVVRSKM